LLFVIEICSIIILKFQVPKIFIFPEIVILQDQGFVFWNGLLKERLQHRHGWFLFYVPE